MPGAADIIGKIKVMKTLPNIAVRLTRMISDDSSSLQEFEEVIRLDPTLVLRLLKIVNSPYYALASEVESIAEAVAFVGMDNLRNLIVMDIFKHIVTSGPSDSGFSRIRLWRHSAAVGVTSQMISERVFETKGDNAFLCGVIHDIGLIIEDQAEPERFMNAFLACRGQEEKIIAHETREIGCDHTRVGEMIAMDWKLPKAVREGIRDHHNAQKSIDPQSIAGVVQVSEYLVNRMGYSPFDNAKKHLPQSLVSHMHSRIREYKAIAMDLPETLKRTDDVFALDS
ncbi:MAG: HDOD domain-containing protein [Desulfobacter sp.]